MGSAKQQRSKEDQRNAEGCGEDDGEALKKIKGPKFL
jgi:hypothetical protein